MNKFIDNLVYFARFVAQLPSVYHPKGEPHVFLFSTRRSGSTLLRDMIYSQPGFNYVDQPTSTIQVNPYTRFLPNSDLNQYINLNESDLKKFKKYIDNILKRKYIIRSQWQVWDKHYHWVWGRYVLKILNASPLIDWFQETYAESGRIVYLTRHPIATSLSIIQRGWGITANSYLNNSYFRNKYLSEETVCIGNQILENGSLLEKHVLGWCLENLVPLSTWQERSWLTVSYENIVSNPVSVSNRICSILDLPNPERMMNVVRKPTRTAQSSSRKSILVNGSKNRASDWWTKIRNEERSKIDEILKCFQINLYSANSPYPDEEFDTWNLIS